jgi:hypothetical protein
VADSSSSAGSDLSELDCIGPDEDPVLEAIVCVWH